MIAHRLRALGLIVDSEPEPPARPGWERFLVAQRPPSATEWGLHDRAKIAQAREAYDRGTHEMVTVMTSGRWTQLYLRPRRTAAPERHYFRRGA